MKLHRKRNPANGTLRPITYEDRKARREHPYLYAPSTSSDSSDVIRHLKWARFWIILAGLFGLLTGIVWYTTR